jgi:hypothetical protein
MTDRQRKKVNMRLIQALVLVLCVTGCGGMPITPTVDAGGCDIAADAVYPAEGFEQNTVAERSLLARLNALSAPMRAAELDAGVTTDRATLDGLWAAGNPSLASMTPSAYQPIVDEALTLFLAAQGQVWVPANPPTGRGGLYGEAATSWIFSERGVDLRQVIDKGLYGALFFREARQRLPSATTPESIDQLVALFGAHPSFPANDGSIQPRDELMARYAKRRTLMGVGPYPRLKAAFTRARLAAAAGVVCNAEREAALSVISDEWEKTLVSTAIFYMNSAAARLQSPMPSLATRAQAMHDVGEGAAFLMGLKAVPVSARRIDDATLDRVLATLRASSLSNAGLYRLVTVVPADVDSLLNAVPLLQAVYGFTPDELTRFRANY